MKVSIFIYLCLFVVISTSLYAQYSYTIENDSAGIYLTYKDFKNGKLTNGFKTYQKNYSLWAQGFFKYKDLELITPDTTVVYKRSNIWGYTNHKGRLIRVFNNKHYKVLCDKGLVIYIIHSPTSTSIYFSKTLNHPIYRLTRKRLSKIYQSHLNVLQTLKSTKKSDWLIWDKKNEYYLINSLFFS
ncbi:MAG: hypothetical protein K0B10_07955 [Vicingaceae bacterium]|nr:hypothetical protein [Vicingaceae bacterium]